MVTSGDFTWPRRSLGADCLQVQVRDYFPVIKKKNPDVLHTKSDLWLLLKTGSEDAWG